MSKEDLNSALLQGLNALDGKVEQSKPELATQDVAPEVSTDTVDGTTTDDAGVDGKDTQAKDAKDPYASRVKNLVRRRHALEEEVATKDAALSEKDREIAELKAQLGNKDEEVDPDTKIRNTIREELAHDKKLSKQEQMDREEWTDLVKRIPKAAERKAQIDELAVKHPTLSFEAIDRMLAPQDYVDPVESNRQNAKRLSGAGRSRAELAQNFDPKTAPLKDLRAALSSAIESGELVV